MGNRKTGKTLMLLMATSVPGQRVTCQDRSFTSLDKPVLFCVSCKLSIQGLSTCCCVGHCCTSLFTDGLSFEKSCQMWKRQKIKEVCLSLKKTLVSEMFDKILGNVCLQTCVIKYMQSNCHVALWGTGKVCVCLCVCVCRGVFSFGLN